MAESEASTTLPGEWRHALALALDLEDLAAARRLARSVTAQFAIAKVGLELFASAGPAAVDALRADGFELFVDLKLHDIPTTVRRAAAALGRLGVSYVTVHVAGGAAMLEAAREGLEAGAASVGLPEPIALGVTVLTSEPDAPASLLAERAGLGAAAGLGGLVCSALDLETVRAAAPGLVLVVPGTRLPGEAHDDQARVATPNEAFARGADVLVIGRSVTAAPDPPTAAAALISALGA